MAPAAEEAASGRLLGAANDGESGDGDAGDEDLAKSFGGHGGPWSAVEVGAPSANWSLRTGCFEPVAK